MENGTEKKESTKNKPISWMCEIIGENGNDNDKLNFAWIFSNAPADDNASRYGFLVRRYKITATKEEYLSVKVIEIKRDENGEVQNFDERAEDDCCAEIERVSIIDLENKLLDLRTYGVIMERKHFPKVRREIEKVYLKLTKRGVNDSTSLTDDVILSTYEVFVRFIKEVKLDKDNGLYNIPIIDFKDHLLDSDFSKYKYSEIRAGLADLKVKVKEKHVNATKCQLWKN